MSKLSGYVLECDDVLCKSVEYTKMIDKLYESFVFACSTFTEEAIPHTGIHIKKIVLVGRSS